MCHAILSHVASCHVESRRVMSCHVQGCPRRVRGVFDMAFPLGGGFQGVCVGGCGGRFAARGYGCTVHGACVSRGRRGEWWQLASGRASFVWLARESSASGEIAGFRGPVRQIGCVRASRCARRGENVAGSGNTRICTRDGRFAQRNGSLTQRARCVSRPLVLSCGSLLVSCYVVSCNDLPC